MSENEVSNYRLEVLEKDVSVLYKKVNEITLTQAQSVTKLDSMLVTLGELKANVESIRKRPATLWDKILIAIISAVCGVIVTGVMR